MNRCRDLAALLGPTGVESFLERHWGRSPLLVRRDDPGFLRGLFSTADVEPAITAAGPGAAAATTVQAVRSVDGVTTHRDLRTDSSGRVVVASVHDAYADGHTVIVNHVSRTHAAVGELCGELERVLQHPVGCNLFLTPGDACGFVPHYDAMDTFFLQIDGRKRWKVWSPVVELPIGERFDKPPPDSLGAPVLDVELAPGDMLYLPRGWVHHGLTGETPSLHLTLGVSVTRWVDLLVEQVRRAATQDVRLREAIPLDERAPVDEHELDRRGRELLATVAATNDATIVAALLAERVTSRPSPLGSHFPDLDAIGRITATTRVHRRSGLAPVASGAGYRSVLSFAGSSVTGPIEALAAFRMIADRSSFRAVDLPGLPEEVGLQLVVRLVREGLLGPDTPRS